MRDKEVREIPQMKVLRTAVMLTLLLAGPAFAQGAKPPPPSDPPKGPGEVEREKSADKAYKNSLRNIPDQPPADPWGGARAVDGSSSAATQPKKTRASGSTN
jgi:hypothetical protein